MFYNKNEQILTMLWKIAFFDVHVTISGLVVLFNFDCETKSDASCNYNEQIGVKIKSNHVLVFLYLLHSGHLID